MSMMQRRLDLNPPLTQLTASAEVRSSSEWHNAEIQPIKYLMAEKIVGIAGTDLNRNCGLLMVSYVVQSSLNGWYASTAGVVRYASQGKKSQPRLTNASITRPLKPPKSQSRTKALPASAAEQSPLQALLPGSVIETEFRYHRAIPASSNSATDRSSENASTFAAVAVDCGQMRGLSGTIRPRCRTDRNVPTTFIDRLCRWP